MQKDFLQFTFWGGMHNILSEEEWTSQSFQLPLEGNNSEYTEGTETSFSFTIFSTFSDCLNRPPKICFLLHGKFSMGLH